MNSDSDVKKRVQTLAVNISESGDENLAWKLLTIADVLEDCRRSSSRTHLTSAQQEIWRCGLLETIVDILNESFDDVKGAWTTAAKLCQIASECIENVAVVQSKPDFVSKAVETILLAASVQQEKFVAILASGASKAEAKQLLDDFRLTLRSAVRICTALPTYASHFLQLPLLLHMLITENTETAHLLLASVKTIVEGDPTVVTTVDQVLISNLLDEIVFKISSTQEALIACSAIRVGLCLVDASRSLLPLFIAQYSGLKPLIGKWKRQGFDEDVNQLVAFLEVDQEEKLAEKRRNDAACCIQAHWRGCRTRKQLTVAQAGIVKLQRLVRDRLLQKREGKETARLSAVVQQAKEDQYRQEMRQSMMKQMQYMQHMPAGKIDDYLMERESKASTVLQTRYRGLLARRKVAQRRVQVERNKAARRIQRNYREHLGRRKREEKRPGQKSSFLLRDISEERRRELQEKIAVGRERKPYLFDSMDALRDLHEKAQQMMGKFLTRGVREREQDVRRRSLVARLQSDAEQFLSAPRLEDVTSEDIEAFSSVSAPVAAMAQRAHAEEIKAASLPWWKRVPLEGSVDFAELGIGEA
eukprot:m.43145 g.43145  ORF g.43145 m.43145 type:complete len:587 (+) comp33418_c0_seq1:92-1852(+)